MPTPPLSWRAPAALAAALALTGATGCAPSSDVAAASPAAPEVSTLPVVAVTHPSEETVGRQVQLTGEFRPWQQADLHAKIAGYLKTLSVDVGTVVRAGQPIGVLEVPELDAEILEAQAAVARGESEEARAAAQLTRAEAQVTVSKAAEQRLRAVNQREPGLVAGQEVDESVARFRSAEADVAAARAHQAAARQQIEAARARLQRVRTMTEYTRITAPFAGVVTRRFADPGNMIQAGTASQVQAMPLVRIADVHTLRLAIVVPENVVPQVNVGTAVEISIPALARTIPGRIARFAEQVATNSRSMEAEVDVPNPARDIRPGMVADIRIQAQTPARVLTVPHQAVARRGGQSFVLIVAADGTVEERRVETGEENASRIEIRSGATAEDRVVVGNRTLVRPGGKVQARQGASV